MSSHDAEAEYVSGQYRPSFPATFAAFEQLNLAARAGGTWLWDLHYGAHPRCTFDLRISRAARRRGLLLYLHAGYWQSRDKAQFHFIAPALDDAGFDVAMANYPLCPEVTVAQIVEAVLPLPAALRRARAVAERDVPMLVAGHSAGAHLAVELALAGRAGLLHGACVDAILPISGVYDLSALIGTSLNANLKLDVASAAACSPLHRVVGGLPPAHFLVGELETQHFRRQSADMSTAWSTCANQAGLQVVPMADHFTVLQEFCIPGSPTLGALERLLKPPTTR